MSRMSRAMVVGLGIVLAGAGYLQAAWLDDAGFQPPRARAAASQARPSSQVPPAASPQALLDRYCLTCHTETLVERGTVPISLQGLDVSDVGAHAEIWEGVVQKLRTATMPPAGRPRPDKATYDAFATWLETELGQAAAANLNPGRVARGPSPQSVRIWQRHPRLAGAGGGHRRVPARRRVWVRLRQHRKCPLAHPGAARAIPVNGAQDRSSRRRRSDTAPGD